MSLSVRRLRRLPAVVVPRVPPQEHLLNTVRLFDPEAAPVDGGITYGAGIRLAGPYPVTPDVAEKASLPQGHAYLMSDSGPFQTWLTRGLARRYGGHAHLPRQTISEDIGEIVIVHTPRKVSPDELAARLSGHLPQLTAERPESDGSFFLTTAYAPIQIRCDSPEVESLRWLLPLALGPLRREAGLHGYRFGIVPGGDVRAVPLLVTAALELARGVSGIATDADRFRVFRPEDLGFRR